MKFHSKIIIGLALILATPVNSFAFLDVPKNSWYTQSVEELRDLEIIDDADYFRPNDELNRAEFMKMIMVLVDGTNGYEPNNTPIFADVNLEEWYGIYIEAAATLGIVTGYLNEDGSYTNLFKPENPVTRAEAVEVLVKTFQLSLQNELEVIFPDVQESDWFYENTFIAYEWGLIDGYEDGTFKPHQPVKRSEIAQIIYRGLNPEIRERCHFFYQIGSEEWLACEGEITIIESCDFIYRPSEESEDWLNVCAPKDCASYEEPLMSYDGATNFPTTEFEETINFNNKNILKGCVYYFFEHNKEPEPEEKPDVEPPIELDPEEAIEIFQPSDFNSRSKIIGDGEVHLAAQYYFKGGLQGYNVEKLTVVNDILGDDFGDDAQATGTIEKIIIKYPDESGAAKTKESPLPSGGKITFSNLDFFVKENNSTAIEIYVETNDFGGSSDRFSGETIRLGIQNVSNTSETFQANGEFSGQLNSFSNSDLNLSRSEVSEMTIRESGPLLLETISLENPKLFNGENKLIQISLETSDSATLNRMVFEVVVEGNVTLSDFKVRKNNNIVEDVVIYDVNGDQDLTTANLTQGVHPVIISFDRDQDLSSSPSIYTLEVQMSGVEEGDYVVTRLLEDDTPLSGLTATEQENTGKIYVTGDATAGIFTNDSDFSQAVGVNRNLIWSDESGKPHQDPNINAGVVENDSGSSDYTNGAYLDWREVNVQVLSK